MFELLVLIGIIFIIAIFLSSPPKGNVGESRVSYNAKSFTRKNSASESFDNVILKTPDGTTQIDHIIISIYGIFVIETKGYTGWIFGNENQQKWTQSLIGPRKFSIFGRRYSSVKYKFQNPLRQNYKHVKAVQKFLNVNMNKIFSIIVFTGDSEFKSEMPDNVIELHELPSYLNSYKEQILNVETVEMLSKKMSDYLLNSEIDEEDHIENIINNRDNPICPKCGSKMILRTAKKGKSAGSQFWGCRNFPSCKIIKTYNN
jgi:hypothetical protein